MALFQVTNLSFNYPDEQPILKNITLKIEEGQFVVLCGPSGCGKTTLLRLLMQQIAPIGELSGDIYYCGKALAEWSNRTLIEEIGFVMQNPDNQIVLDEVMQEIVFALENLGYSTFEMRKRVAEMVHFFGVEDLLRKKPSELSGGQKQIINLLGVLLLKPRVLLLDEPTSQLDPIAAKELLSILVRLNEEIGITIIVVEHRLEELFSVADQVMMMDKGRIQVAGTSEYCISKVYKNDYAIFKSYVPAITKFFITMEGEQSRSLPLSVKEGKQWLATKNLASVTKELLQSKVNQNEQNILIEMKDVYFQYVKKERYILKGLSFLIQKGEFLAIVGGNGSGKSTLLKACIGSIRPQRGSVKIAGKHTYKLLPKEIAQQLAYLPQNPQSYFVETTIKKDMQEAVRRNNVVDGPERIEAICKDFDISHLLDRHPEDCSGGEMQRAALACMLLGEPQIVFMDEPTKGMDPIMKEQFATILHQLHKKGVTIVMVTHDIEFTAKTAKNCIMLFDGEVAVKGTPDEIFKGNYFYTTTFNRVTRNSHMPELLTVEEALELWPVQIKSY